MRHLDRHWIGGRWTEPSGDGRIHVINPATEQLAFSVPEVTPSEVDTAVALAQQAYLRGDWYRAGVAERAAVIERAAEIIPGRAAEIGQIMTEEMGAPLTGTVGGHVPASVATMREMAAFARVIPEREIRTGRGSDALVMREPVGPVAALTPWNGPFATAVNKVVAALLMGCPVIAKPSPQTPVDIYHLAAALAEAGLPEGLLSVLPAGAAESGRLVSHPDVTAVSFTGSTAVGTRIGEVCGRRFARVQLELGGKSAAVILDDADITEVSAVLRSGVFRNAGQVCTALTRVLAPRDRYEEVIEKLCDTAAGIVVGDPMDPATEMGPLAIEAQRDRCESFIAEAREDGARVAFGGDRPPGLDRGWYLRPTVLRDVHNGMRAAQEEIFGPIAVVIPHDGDDDAIAIANDSPYGLHGAVFTADPGRALVVATRVRTGTFSLNACVNNPTPPFGGVKASGIGREHDREGLEFFTELKTVNLGGGLGAEHALALLRGAP
ncbi:aldehyde dehydrogenase [Spirillospora sp. NPDC048819]|uniref:aldehyde dehydrogenase n=1 Tax=Spirillospora sp. NPDC048819 TaxID=3155268 RepID=UPI0033F61618